MKEFLFYILQWSERKEKRINSVTVKSCFAISSCIYMLACGNNAIWKKNCYISKKVFFFLFLVVTISFSFHRGDDDDERENHDNSHFGVKIPAFECTRWYINLMDYFMFIFHHKEAMFSSIKRILFKCFTVKKKIVL